MANDCSCGPLCVCISLRVCVCVREWRDWICSNVYGIWSQYTHTHTQTLTTFQQFHIQRCICSWLWVILFIFFFFTWFRFAYKSKINHLNNGGSFDSNLNELFYRYIYIKHTFILYSYTSVYRNNIVVCCFCVPFPLLVLFHYFAYFYPISSLVSQSLCIHFHIHTVRCSL